MGGSSVLGLRVFLFFFGGGVLDFGVVLGSFWGFIEAYCVF